MPWTRAALLLSKNKHVKISLKNIPLLCLMAVALASCGTTSKDNALPPDIEVKTLTVEAAGHSQYAYIKASGDWNVEICGLDGANVDWVLVKPASGEGNKTVSLVVAANESEKERSAVIAVKSNAGEASATLTQKGKTTVTPTPDPKPNGGNLSSKTGWLELPAIPEGADAFTHSMKIGSVKTRNYSFVWDYDNLVAPWVAYPLSKWNTGSGGRSNQWALDPLLPKSKQPVLYKGFSEGNAGWFARGHQIPSADRPNVNADDKTNANAMTFYGTNMTPQINDKFNADIWANLESKVRSWADRSDTLYVVTGCVIDYKEGETVKYALDNEGKKVTVPTAYYKVVLRYMKSSTFGYSGYSACAVWLDHKAYDTKNINSSYSMSVDDLEKKTGIDFFVNLQAKVGDDVAAKIEAEDPAKVSWWW